MIPLLIIVAVDLKTRVMAPGVVEPDPISEVQALVARARNEEARGDHDAAVNAWREAVARDPLDFDILLALTECLANVGRAHEALAACDTAVEQGCDGVLVRLQAGTLRYWRLRDRSGAIADFEAVLEMDPENTQAHLRLADIHFENMDVGPARRHAEMALRTAEPRIALWLRYRYLADYAGVLQMGREMISAAPADAKTLLEMGRSLYMLGRREEAFGIFARAAEHAPADGAVVFAMAECLLLVGDPAAGWRRFASLATDQVLRNIDPKVRPTWDTHWSGQPLAGKTILVVHYLGIGDNIMMARYAASLKAAGAHVTFCCRPELFRLFQGLAGVDVLIHDWNSRPWTDWDYWTFDYLAPRWLGAAENHVPAFPGGYIAAPPPSAAAPGHTPGRLNVGLCWSSVPTHFSGAARFLEPADLGPLAELADIDWYVVQKTPTQATLAGGGGPRAVDRSAEWSDFYDTAAFMAGLDLVISADSSPLHLAGALGKPAWGLICAAPDWKWGASGETSRWYPDTRLFRQERLGEWGPVVAAVKTALATYPRS